MLRRLARTRAKAPKTAALPPEGSRRAATAFTASQIMVPAIFPNFRFWRIFGTGEMILRERQ